MTQEPPQTKIKVTDGDDVFIKVDTQRAAGQLEPGVVADAVNTRFEFGEAWPRLGVARQPWGDRTVNLVDTTTLNALATDGTVYAVLTTITGFTIGETYSWTKVNSTSLSTGYVSSATLIWEATGTVYTESTTFVATATTYYLLLQSTTNPGTPYYWRDIITTDDYSPIALARFNDPDGVDNLVLITDEWRTDTDGGRGRAWRIKSGNTPQEIPLNGHDVWDTSRLVQVFNGQLLFRHGAERHYFPAASVNTTTDVFTLNCIPSWNIGDLVLFQLADQDSTLVGSSPPNVGATYYVGDNGGTSTAIAASSVTVSLHTTRAGALANTGKLNYATAVGRFYLERAAEQPGYFGNNQPPLLLQGTETTTVFEVGFEALATATVISATLGATTVTARNHRLIPGDAVTFGGTSLFTAGTKYVRPLSDHAFTVHATEDDALANDSAIASAATASDSVLRLGANGLPLPPSKEGIYYKQRVIALNSKSLVIGDPLDPLRCTPFLNTLPANQGESDRPTALVPMGEDYVLILKENSVLAVSGIGGESTGWEEVAVTREYGCIAPLTGIIVGKDVWMLSRRGVMSVTQTSQGILQGVTDPVSRPLQKYFDRIDWASAHQACAETWNNRYFIAVPSKGQTDTIKNDMVLVYNFLNQGWEGVWEGDDLEVYAFARHQVYQDERLCFVDYAGRVNFLTDGWTDTGDTAVATSLTTREYFNSTRVLVTKADLNWDSWNPSVTIKSKAPGYNEVSTLRSGITYDRTRYVKFGQVDYDPATSTTEDFDREKREDYSTTAEELLVGVTDAHQNMQERAQMRVDDLGCQLIIENAQGSMRLKAVELHAVTKPRSHKRRT